MARRGARQQLLPAGFIPMRQHKHVWGVARGFYALENGNPVNLAHHVS
jgi:hypothetical protein